MRMDEREEIEKFSACSSGCQSGWTMYLDQSNEKLNSLPLHKAISMEGEEEEEEDLSMVSDASSGPPHLHEEEHERYWYCRNGCFSSASSLNPLAAFANNGAKKMRAEADCSFLDDTASSPFFSFSKTNSNATATTNTNNNNNNNNNKNKKKPTKEELSCGFSATHFKVVRGEGEKKAR